MNEDTLSGPRSILRHSNNRRVTNGKDQVPEGIVRHYDL
jgi:hypothetical protein